MQSCTLYTLVSTYETSPLLEDEPFVFRIEVWLSAAGSYHPRVSRLERYRVQPTAFHPDGNLKYGPVDSELIVIDRARIDFDEGSAATEQECLTKALRELERQFPCRFSGTA